MTHILLNYRNSILRAAYVVTRRKNFNVELGHVHVISK